MLYIALRMLFGDRSKYLLLICSLGFASLLISQQAAVFFGLMRWSTAFLRNSYAQIYVVDPMVEQVNETNAMRLIELQRVRSVPGVKWAMPISFNILLAKLPNGHFQNLQVVGFDDTTLAGAPRSIIKGSFTDLARVDGVVIDQIAVEKLSARFGRVIDIGDSFEINDHRVVVVGICQVERTFFGYGSIYTTFNRSLEIRPPERKGLDMVICEAIDGVSDVELAKRIQEQTALKAFTEKELFWSSIWWFVKNTGIPISFGTTVLLGFLVGIAVAGQTFYSFILENLPHFGALKAMGISNKTLLRMLIVQAFIVGMTGYGLGLGFTALFGYAVMDRGNPPFYMLPELLLISFLAILFITTFSVILGIRKVNAVDPAQVFRS
jgi:putative ABC transport system permease protein